MNSLKKNCPFDWVQHSLNQGGMKSFYLIPLKYTSQRGKRILLCCSRKWRGGVVLSLNTSAEAWRLEQDYLSLTDTDMPPNGRGREGERRALWLQWLQCPQPWSGHWSWAWWAGRMLPAMVQGTEDPPRSEDSDLRDNPEGPGVFLDFPARQWATLRFLYDPTGWEQGKEAINGSDELPSHTGGSWDVSFDFT